MIRTRIAAALTSLAVVSFANAGFHLSSTQQGTISGYHVYLIRAINDGNGTGTELDGYDLNFTLLGGIHAYFSVIDGQVDLINTSNPNRGFMRVGSAATTSIVYTSPHVSLGTPWESIQSWNIAAISTGNEYASGIGAVVAKLFIDGSGVANVSGSIGGNQGDPQSVNIPYLFLGTIVEPPDPPIVNVNPNSVTINLNSQTSFGPVAVSATHAVGVTSLTAGTIPAQIADNISITGDADGPLTINGSGFGAGDIGTYLINFTAMDAAGNSGMGTFALNVAVPEPATLTLLAGLSFLGLRRRK